MKSNQKTGRTVGFLLLLIMALGIPSVMLRGLSTSMVASPDFLNEIFQNSFQMRIAVLLDILTSALWLIIALLLFPIIKKIQKQFCPMVFWHLARTICSYYIQRYQSFESFVLK